MVSWWIGWLVGWWRSQLAEMRQNCLKVRKEETEGEGWEGIEEFCFEHGTFEMHIRNP